ncbi:MAG TPA: NlpC/P60 family protein [Patescibacteria group bacterium]|nr:NlpC/P60 family protein [Patescibacteria group bacterium]
MKTRRMSAWRHWGVMIVIVLLLNAFNTANASAASVRYAEGDEGLAVATMQLKLKQLGYYHDGITGKYDRQTAAAVKEFQRSLQLTPDGVVNETVYQAINGGKLPPGPAGKEKNPAASVAPVSRNSAPVVKTAMQYLGTPYRFGGAAPGGFDCSGYTSYVFGKHGLKLPRTADVQYKAGKPVNRTSLQPGDLVFFTTYEPGASHVGIYTDQGHFIHASSSKGVMISGLDESYWKTRYLGARRVL